MPTTTGAVLITQDSTTVPITLPDNLDDKLTVMRSVIRCSTVGWVGLTRQWDMWIDDDGVHEHDVNQLASRLAHRYGHTGYLIHGPVLITGHDADTTVPLTDDALTALTAALHDLTRQ
jgi:hypothetical protein